MDRTFSDDDIARVHAQHWREGFGTVSVPELSHFRDLIAEHRPATFIEVGTASGLSGGLTVLMLDAYGGRRFVTVDHDETFFGDRTKETGFLLPVIGEGTVVEVVRRTRSTSLEVPGRGETFDMAFVDANHQHPWPLIDTLCLYPVLTGSRIVIHDDLDLYKRQPTGRGIGPKFLHDQVPPEHRRRYAENGGNLFHMSMDMGRDVLEQLAIDAFAMPWTLTHRLKGEQLELLREVLRDHYSPRLCDRFEASLAKYNHPTGRHYCEKQGGAAPAGRGRRQPPARRRDVLLGRLPARLRRG